MLRLNLKYLPALLAILFILAAITNLRAPDAGGPRPAVRDGSHTDRADGPLLRQLSRQQQPGRGLKRMSVSPTGTTSSSPPAATGQTCYDPARTTPWTDVDTDALCKCADYPDPDAGGARYNAGVYGGTAECWATLVPRKANQTRAMDSRAGSFSACIGACLGSFERKRDDGGEYWFCHGVNFVEGEKCEFVGEIAYAKVTPGANCWDGGFSSGG